MYYLKENLNNTIEIINYNKNRFFISVEEVKVIMHCAFTILWFICLCYTEFITVLKVPTIQTL